ncbi:hypothetical protein TNCV_3723931 [Trichonephila clavipes]|nr:hypothetical protein TNCV_3723931 [Trichonephila clavipes]
METYFSQQVVEKLCLFICVQLQTPFLKDAQQARRKIQTKVCIAAFGENAVRGIRLQKEAKNSSNGCHRKAQSLLLHRKRTHA